MDSFSTEARYILSGLFFAIMVAALGFVCVMGRDLVAEYKKPKRDRASDLLLLYCIMGLYLIMITVTGLFIYLRLWP